MKKIFLITLCLFAVFACADNWPKVYDSANNKWISFDDLSAAMAENQMIFVGEYHDHVWGHKVELMLFEAYHKKYDNIAIAFEMFERDTQNIMNGYLAGEVTEKFFLENSRPWGNYSTAYRPMVEYARAYKLPVLAMNVPRRFAASAAGGKEDFFSQLPKLEKSYIVPNILALPGKYRDKFYKTMEGHVPPAVIEKYYRSQCLKDDTMAKSIVEFLAENPEAGVISYTGSFHSDEGLGLVEKVRLQKSSTKNLVLSIKLADDEALAHPEKYAAMGDFILFAPGNASGEKNDLLTKFSDMNK